jgi:hypothetical protein
LQQRGCLRCGVISGGEVKIWRFSSPQTAPAKPEAITHRCHGAAGNLSVAGRLLSGLITDKGKAISPFPDRPEASPQHHRPPPGQLIDHVTSRYGATSGADLVAKTTARHWLLTRGRCGHGERKSIAAYTVAAFCKTTQPTFQRPPATTPRRPPRRTAAGSIL